MSHAVESFDLEQHCRRSCWRRGRPLRLTDGASWHLPAVDADLLSQDLNLAEELREVQAFARIRSFANDQPQTALDELCRFHGWLARIAIRVLRTNYELPDCAWEPLLIGNSLVETFQMTIALALALEDGRHGLAPPVLRALPDPSHSARPDRPTRLAAMPTDGQCPETGRPSSIPPAEDRARHRSAPDERPPGEARTKSDLLRSDGDDAFTLEGD